MVFEPTVTLSGISVLVTLVGGVWAIIGQQRKIRRENEADGRARTDELKAEFLNAQTTHGEKIAKLEERTSGFMHRTEIEGKFEHEKANRQATERVLKDAAEGAQRGVNDLRVSVGKVEQRLDGMGDSVAKIEAGQREQNAKLDRIMEITMRLEARA